MDTLTESLLPGLEVEQELQDPISDPAPGRLFRVRDVRAFPETPVIRFARVIDPDQSRTEWGSRFSERVRRLMETPFPSVLTPDDVVTTPEGTLIVLEHPWSFSLADRIPATSGMPDRRHALRLLEQILTGLAALHDRGLAHGDLRPGNIAILPSTPSGKTETAWLANTALGGLTSDSQGAFVAADAKQFFPPEWHGQAQKPTPQADLYAVGVLAHKMAHGLQSLPPAATESGSWWKTLSQGLTGDELGGMARLLLRDPERRPAHAGQALKQVQIWRRWVARRGFYALSLLIVGIVTAALLGLWSQSSEAAKQVDSLQTRLKSLEGEAAALKLSNKNLSGGHSSLQQEKEDLETANKRLREELAQVQPTPSSPTPEQVARHLWNDMLAQENFELDRSREVSQGIGPAHPQCQGFSADQCQQVKKAFQEWQKVVNDADQKQQYWSATDEVIRILYSSLSKTPWDPVRQAQFSQRDQDLRTAATVWFKWAEDGHLTFPDLYDRVRGQNADVEKILRAWLGRIENTRDWSIRWKSGKAPQGSGTYRGLWVSGEDWSPPDWHDWSGETAHDYSQSDKTTRFSYSAGKPLIIALQGGLNWWVAGSSRPNRIYREFTGPLAIWQAHQRGKVVQNGFELEFEVVHCPGPPRTPFSIVLSQGVFQ